MIAKQNPIVRHENLLLYKKYNDLDVDSCILHSAQTGIPFEEYMKRVTRDGRKKITRMIEGLET